MTTTFDEVGADFVSYYETVRGAVREDLARINLEPHLPDQPARAIDVGGGDGRDASWLVSLGYEVTLVDPSVEMLKLAEERFSQLGQQVLAIQGTAETVTEDHGDYDLVLSHGVLMYCLDKPQDHIDNLGRLARHGGIVSLLTKGFDGALARFDDVTSEEARDLIGTHQILNNLGVKVWALKPDEIKGLLRRANLDLLDWHGVRVETETDKRVMATVPAEEYAAILASEKATGDNPRRRKFGQMLHFIARA